MDEQPGGTNVRVAVRIRPLSARERLAGANEVIGVGADGRTVQAAPDRHFTFDTVFPTAASQRELFEELARPLVDWFVDGFNCTVLAYGQTGSGKTFTMGTGLDGLDECTVGIIPRAVQYLLGRLERLFPTGETGTGTGDFFEIYASFLELYNEEIIDLLNPSSQDRADRTKRPVLTIREDSSHGICIAGIKEEKALSLEQILECLQKGQLGRTTKSTEMNLVSSRSHAIFTLTLRQRRMVCDADGIPAAKNFVSKLHFVDLAGSERLKRTGVVGERAKESISINSGLLALGNVISALGDETKRATHVPYRDSKLTRLLQDSLGGNSRTAMIACISPSSDNYAETLNTLKYANRARNIKNTAVLNEDTGGNAAFEIMQLKKQVAALKTEIFQLRGLHGARRAIEVGATPRKGSISEGEETARLRAQHRELQRKLDALQREKLSIEAERDFYKSHAGTGGHGEREIAIIREHLRTIAELKSRVAELESNRHPSNVGHAAAPRRRTIGSSGPARLVSSATPAEYPESPPPPAWFNKANAVIDRTRQELQENAHLMTELRHNSLDDLMTKSSPSSVSDGDGESQPSFASREAFAAAVIARTDSLMSQLQNDQRLKEELIIQLENGQQEYLVMRRKYEERLRLLQENVAAVQKERDQALRNTMGAPREDARTMRLKYEEKIKKMGREMNELKDRLAEISRDNGSRSAANDVLVRNLRSALQAAKGEKTRMQSRLEELQQRLQQTAGGQEHEIKELRQKERRASEQARKYKKAYEFQKSLLQKRVEQYLQTKNRVRFLVNALRKHRVPLSPSVGNLSNWLESPSSSWRRIPEGPGGGGAAVTATLPPTTPSGLASKSISAEDLQRVHELSLEEDAEEGASRLVTSDPDDDPLEDSFLDPPPLLHPHPHLQTPSKSTSSHGSRRSSLVRKGQPLIAPPGADLPRSVLRMSPLIPRRTDIFSRIADSASYSLAVSQLANMPSFGSSASRMASQGSLEGGGRPAGSPMRIDSSMDLDEDVLKFYRRSASSVD